MEVPSIRNRIGGNWAGQLLSSRRGAVSVAAVAALLAGVLLYLFVQHYRQAPAVAAPTQAVVFVASQYIPAGTPASSLASEGLLKRTEVPLNDAVVGAISDPSAITGEVSSASVSAGQQISVTDFSHTAVSLGSYLTGDYRAIAVPLDAPHGLTSYLAEGDTVDVMVDKGAKTQVLAEDINVLANAGGDVVLKVTDTQALTIAGASDNTKIWLTLRPPTGGRDTVKVGSQENNL
jgi:Flp pilus assembly protein CpaB